jgi:type I restriction enzyme, S subunit
MIEGLKPYAEYKKSGAPWSGDVPAHWGVGRLGAVFGERGETNKNREVTEVLSVLKDIGVIPYSEKGRIGNNKSEDIGRYKIVRPDDLVVNCMNVIIGSVGRSRYTGCLSPVYYVLKRRNSENLPRFLELLFQHKPFQRSLVRIGNGILAHRMRIPMEKLKAELFPTPPPDEQAAIVRFLDHANRKIDSFIRAKRKLIGLLKEQKQVVIHHAVTRGLAHDVQRKPSGIPWFGEIPAHWEVWRISRFAKVGNGSTPSRGNAGFWIGGNYPWLNSSHVNRGFIDSADQFVTSTALRECHLPRVAAGSVLIAITGQGKTRGTSAVLGIEATINQHIAYVTPRLSVVSAEFLHLSLVAAYSTLRAMSDDSGSTKGALTCEDLKRFKLAVPPLEEQNQLVAVILRETKAADTAIARTDREIALVQEYRTRLTADVVTGKLDVREAAAKLPDTPGTVAPFEADVLDEGDILDDTDEQGMLNDA